MKKPIADRILLAVLAWLLWPGGQTLEAQFIKPRVYAGALVGGGMSVTLNQNNYGFPEMDYKPAVISQVGGHIGLAMRPWSRLQLDVQIFSGSYKFSEEYSSNSTEGIISLRKQVEFTLINIPLTYRHYLVDPDISAVGTEKSMALALQKKHTFFILIGPQITRFRKADVAYQKNSSSTGFKWQPADLIDIKPGFDAYVPIDEIPDHLPDDTRDLYQETILCLVGGLGWNMVLAPRLEITLEAQGFMSLLDLNSSARDKQNRYLWRRRVYSASDPEAYFPSVLQSVTLNAGIHYTF